MLKDHNEEIRSIDFMKADVQILTLGQLRVQKDGQPLDGFISTKAVLLFAYLAMYPIEHTRKKLATMLWSETNDQQALKNLRTVLSSVRQTVPDALIVMRESLSINPEALIDVDASRFEHGCNIAFKSPDMPDLLAYMQDLAALYSGMFLADIAIREAASFNEWAMDTQRHLHQLYTRLLYEITVQAQNEADYQTGIHYARQLVNIDPYWDDGQRQLMRLLVYTNHTNEALLQYDNFAQLLDEELGAIPEEETTALYEQIRAQDIRPPQSTKSSSIVLPDIPFVEAMEDITLIQRMLNTTQCHLLTIYGISGIGKTALATYIAYQRQHLYRDGAYLVSLKGAQSARDIPYLISGTLGVDFSNYTDAKDLQDFLLDYLRDRQILLFLDNYEHLLPETYFIQDILEQAPQVQVIVTSQTPLNLFREWLIPLRGLRIPEANEENPETYESVQLFKLTAQRINPRFDLQEHLAHVIDICALVDGLPLAIIIAAGWTQIAPINKIIDYIVEGQEFNLPVQQDMPKRHQSLEMMMEYTWNTLSDAEQYTLIALSIFNTSFGEEEAMQICDIEFDMLTTMIHKSLIQRYGDKYRMHQLIWRYARKKLLYNDQKEALGQRYMNYIIDLLDDLQKQKLPLHEYLIAIEMQYATIWNYDWMAKSFQPTYFLTLSRFLIAYWEISRIDELDTLQKLFENMQESDLSSEARMLRRLQLARFHYLGKQYEQAHHNLRIIQQENPINASWADWGRAFNLLMPLFKFMTTEHRGITSDSSDEDAIILSNSYLKLLSLYLDMRDYEATENFFLYLLESVHHHPTDSALILATRGAISAENEDFLMAFTHFSNALHYLQQTDEILLKLSLSTLLMRIAHLLGQPRTFHTYLTQALTIAADIGAKTALLQLLEFCTHLPNIESELQSYLQTSIEELRLPQPPHTLHTVASEVIEEIRA